MSKQKRGTGMVSKALLKEAAELLPKMPHTDDITEIKNFLENNLPFNSETTRKRYRSYITTYLFPEDNVDHEILNFAQYASSESIKNVCLYRFSEKYPLIYDIFKDVFLPNLNKRKIQKKELDDYLKKRFSNNNPGRFGGRGFVEALTGANVMIYQKGMLKYQHRPIDLSSFTFILHSEFPTPGMYNINLLKENQAFIPQLWRKQELVDTLYQLRNQDLLSKISNIDMMQQFTTKHTLSEIVEKLGE